jgi:hypothetical protein
MRSAIPDEVEMRGVASKSVLTTNGEARPFITVPVGTTEVWPWNIKV